MVERGVYNEYEQQMLDSLEKLYDKIESEQSEPDLPVATETALYNWACWCDPWNPLWTDPEYAKKTVWGGLYAFPGFQDSISKQDYFPKLPKEGGFLDHNSYGDDWHFYAPMRVGDEFKIVRKRPKYWDISAPEVYDGLRTFGVIKHDIEIYDKKTGELMASSRHHHDWIIRPAALNSAASSLPFEDHYYTPEEWDYINGIIQNETIRGSEKRYWEDVQIGDSVTPTTLGPTTPWDMISFFAARRETKYYPVRWFRENAANSGLLVPSPETNVPHFVAEFHIINSQAERMGNPRAFYAFASARSQMIRLASNWMGDDGFISRVDCRHLMRTPLGDTSVVHGNVVGKWVENGKFRVQLDVWLENLCRGNVSEAGIVYVDLPARNPEEAARTARMDEVVESKFAVGDRVRLKPREDCLPTGYPLAGAEGRVICKFPYRGPMEAYENRYVDVEITNSPTPLGIGNKLTFRAENVEKI